MATPWTPSTPSRRLCAPTAVPVRGDLPEHFAAHCARVNELINGINREYAAFAAREAAEQRLAQIRSLVAGQFGTVSRMLEDMAGELELYERFDFAAARRVGEALRAMGLLPLDVSCRVDRFGRMTVEAEAARGEKTRLSRSELTREVSRACGKPFSPPCVSTAQGKCRIQRAKNPSSVWKPVFPSTSSATAGCAGTAFPALRTAAAARPPC